MRKYTKYSPYLIIVFLFITATILGFKIYGILVATIPQEEITQTPARREEPQQFNSLSDSINVDMSSLINEEHNQLLSLINEEGIETGTIQISANCEISPLAVKISSGTTLKLENVDNIDHSIGILGGPTNIAAGETGEISAEDLKTGIMKYGCDGKPAGYVLVAPE